MLLLHNYLHPAITNDKDRMLINRHHINSAKDRVMSSQKYLFIFLIFFNETAKTITI